MQDSRETKYRKNHVSRAFVTSLAVFCGSGYTKLNGQQYTRSTYCHHEKNASYQSDQSVKWIDNKSFWAEKYTDLYM